MWRNRFGRGFGPVVRQITDDDEYNINVKLTIDNTTTAEINYKELYHSKWDP